MTFCTETQFLVAANLTLALMATVGTIYMCNQCTGSTVILIFIVYLTIVAFLSSYSNLTSQIEDLKSYQWDLHKRVRYLEKSYKKSRGKNER